MPPAGLFYKAIGVTDSKTYGAIFAGTSHFIQHVRASKDFLAVENCDIRLI
jgi:hypothetical protein